MKEKAKASIQEQKFSIRLIMRSIALEQAAEALAAYFPSSVIQESEEGARLAIDHLGRMWTAEALIEETQDPRVLLSAPLLAYEDIDELIYLIDELRYRGARGGEGCGMRFFAAFDEHELKVKLNLQGILISKTFLLEKVLGGKVAASPAMLGENEGMIEALPSPVASDLDLAEIKSCIQFGCAVSAQAKNQARVSASVVSYENERYAFRCWMTRMGMNGDEYKASRKRFLSRLEGDCSFKGGRKSLNQKVS